MKNKKNLLILLVISAPMVPLFTITAQTLDKTHTKENEVAQNESNWLSSNNAKIALAFAAGVAATGLAFYFGGSLGNQNGSIPQHLPSAAEALPTAITFEQILSASQHISTDQVTTLLQSLSKKGLITLENVKYLLYRDGTPNVAICGDLLQYVAQTAAVDTKSVRHAICFSLMKGVLQDAYEKGLQIEISDGKVLLTHVPVNNR